jgi:hypothetical protein
MSVYRYRLAETDATKSVSSFIIEGRRLWKSFWLNSLEPLDFKAHVGLVIEEIAESTDEFDRRDAAASVPKERTPLAVSLVQTPDPLEKEKIEAPSLKKPSVKKETRSVASVLRARGFSHRELIGRSDAQLEELLAFDQIISDKKR